MAVLAVALTIGLTGYAMVVDDRATRERWDMAVESAAALMADRLVAHLKTAQAHLDKVEQILGNRDLAEVAQSEALWRQMVALARLAPDVKSIWVQDAMGNGVLGTPRFPVPKANVQGRAYFQAHERGERYHVGETIRGRTTGQLVFTVSKRLEAPDGGFRGVLLVAMSAPHMVETLPVRMPGMKLGIARVDGAPVLVSPNVAPAAALDAVPAVIDLDQPFAGIREVRLVEVPPFPPLLVSAALPDSFVLGPVTWRNAWRVATVGPPAVVVAVLAWFGLRGIAREEAAWRGLAEARDRLATAVVDKERALEQARQASELKSRFLAAASHDLRQPVQAMRLFVEVLRLRVADPQLQPVVQKAVTALEGAENLLRALLDASLLESGALKPQIAAVSLHGVTEAVQRECLPQAQEKGLLLRVHPCSTVVRSDLVLLQRMLRNLVVNAIRYTGQGRVVIGCRRQGGGARIEVWDTGPGIPAEELDLIFEEFYQIGDRSIDRGHGLGLSTVRKMAALLGHEVRVCSELGRGSMFSIVIPEARASHVVEPVVAEPSPPPVVVIQGDVAKLADLQLHLEKLGWAVSPARSLREAEVDALAHPRTPVAVVIAGSATEAGLTAAALSKAYGRDIRVLRLSGDAVAGVWEETDMLPPPHDPADVSAWLTRLPRSGSGAPSRLG